MGSQRHLFNSVFYLSTPQLVNVTGKKRAKTISRCRGLIKFANPKHRLTRPQQIAHAVFFTLLRVRGTLSSLSCFAHERQRDIKSNWLIYCRPRAPFYLRALRAAAYYNSLTCARAEAHWSELEFVNGKRKREIRGNPITVRGVSERILLRFFSRRSKIRCDRERLIFMKTQSDAKHEWIAVT